MTMIEHLTRADFADLAPGSLQIEAGGHRFAVEVLEAKSLASPSPRAEPFTVLLEGPAQPVLPQGTYGLLHPRHGRLELFLVPVGRTSAAVHYELVFN